MTSWTITQRGWEEHYGWRLEIEYQDFEDTRSQIEVVVMAYDDENPERNALMERIAQTITDALNATP